MISLSADDETQRAAGSIAKLVATAGALALFARAINQVLYRVQSGPFPERVEAHVGGRVRLKAAKPVSASISKSFRFAGVGRVGSTRSLHEPLTSPGRPATRTLLAPAN